MYWFHAFGRHTPGAPLDVNYFLGVLRDGPSPGATATREHENDLGFSVPHVYAYLGRTLPEFGSAAFALTRDALNGTVSPFDTGGLVKKIDPVRTWAQEKRRKYLAQYTWPTADLITLLELHPSSTPDGVATYLDGTKPIQKGPHDLWPADPGTKSLSADIWEQNSDWRAWTWECRQAPPLSVAKKIVQWSCTNPIYEEIVKYANDVAPPHEEDWLTSLLSLFVPGGVSTLVQTLREAQGSVL